MKDIVYYTEEGLEKLKNELDFLKTTERANIAKQIAEARDKGDLSENAEYDAAKEAQGLLEAKIANGRAAFTPGPHSTPSPCGVKIWLCKGTILSSQADYDASTCGQEDVKPKPVPDRCAKFKPNRKCGGSLKRSHPKCRCV